MNGRPAVFLDRDGVINRRRLDHVKSWEEFEFLPGALAALAELHRAGCRVVVITNQAAVGRGLVDEATLTVIHGRMVAAIRAEGGDVEGVYACLHRPEAGCGCRKPRTELFTRAAIDLGIALNGSVVVGDAPSDVQAARALACLPIMIAETHPAIDPAIPVVPDLAAAVSLIAGEREAAPC
jgi:D-glycero-D-manno-heptose 1,7-bisphosphate phosphatase